MGAISINAAEVRGENYTGYEPPNGKGPFECGNCHYFNAGTCGQKTMKSTLPKAKDGRVKVEAKGCCEYVDRKSTGKIYSK